MLSDSVAIKAALLEVVHLLHQCANVHRALALAGSGAPHQRREVPPATLLLYNEIPTGPLGDTPWTGNSAAGLQKRTLSRAIAMTVRDRSTDVRG
jgi:hypothetical protein